MVSLDPPRQNDVEKDDSDEIVKLQCVCMEERHVKNEAAWHGQAPGP